MSNSSEPSDSRPPQTKEIQIVVNGDFRRVPEALNLRDLLAFLDVDPSRVAVEYNRRIVRMPEWNRTTIGSGDQLEIVQFVGGG